MTITCTCDVTLGTHSILLLISADSLQHCNSECKFHKGWYNVNGFQKSTNYCQPFHNYTPAFLSTIDTCLSISVYNPTNPPLPKTKYRSIKLCVFGETLQHMPHYKLLSYNAPALSPTKVTMTAEHTHTLYMHTHSHTHTHKHTHTHTHTHTPFSSSSPPCITTERTDPCSASMKKSWVLPKM